MHLSPLAIAAGTQLNARVSVGSTNAEAFAAARAGASAPLWVVADEQTAGRGRRGRNWRSPRGNLYASLLLIAPGAPQHAAQLSFVAGLSVHDAVLAAAPAARGKLDLKWPNDVLLDGGKIAGVLIEGEDVAGRGQAVVIGCGVNCVSHPHDTPYRAGDLAPYAASRETVFEALSAAMVTRLAEWDRGAGFAATRAAWLARAAGIGLPIRVRTGDRELEGTFGAIDDRGGLLLGLADGGIRTIEAGEIMRLGAPVPREESV